MPKKPNTEKQMARRRPKASRSVKTTEKSNKKLISIRISEDVIKQLRGIASDKGDVGYQQLIQQYISSGIVHENGGELSEKNAMFVEEIASQVQPPKVRSEAHNESKVILEDICNLAKHLKPYHKYFEGKTFVVTGAFGFLGRYIVLLFKYLNEEVLNKKLKAILVDNFVTGYEQQIVSDKNLKFIRHNVITPFDVPDDVDYIIHAAGIASPVYYTKFPIETMDVGTIGTRNMLELARQKDVKSFVFMSSSEVYGDPDNAHVPTAEDYRGNVAMDGPRACYDESKRFGETMCHAYWRVYDTPVKLVRPFNVFGPGIRPDDFRVLPNFIEHALRKEPLPIHGDGRNTRSFCYINDEIEGIFRVLFSDAHGEAFNVGTPGPEISVSELAKAVVKEMPFKVDIVNIDPPHAVYASCDPKRRCPDISKIQKVTGFKPRYSFEEGLRRTIKWFSTR